MAKATKNTKKLNAANDNTKPVKMVERETIFGKKFMEAEDTPYYCSPRSETYWCS